MHWHIADQTRYNATVLGKLIVRKENSDNCRVRMFPRHQHTNSDNNIHGAITLGLIDVSMFATMYVLRGVGGENSVTIDLTTQFVGSGDPSRPLDAVVEVLRETRRLGFLRGLVKQEDDLVASFTGTVRKPTTPR